MYQEINIIDKNLNLTETLKKMFEKEKDYKFKNLKSEEIEKSLESIPALIIIHEDDIDIDIFKLCETIRKNEDNSITPIIVVSSNTNKEHRIKVLSKSVEYFIKKPIDEEYLYYTVKNIVELMNNNRRVSPLTGLPGNVQIQAELKKRLFKEEEFAVLYFDLDNFKAYNDTYGFINGDEIIKLTANIIIKNVHDCEIENAFVGHIGGDDFVAVINKENYEKVCQNILVEFDYKILDYFNENDKEKGYIEVVNRKGIVEQFPLISLSIGVVEVNRGRFHNILEIGEVGAQVKHMAKITLGSAYAVNKRKI